MMRKKRTSKAAKKNANLIEPVAESAGREKWLPFVVLVVIFVFGIYLSVIYFGHKPVPHFDFHCFADLGHQILSFQTPSTFKRVPLVGIMQVVIGKIISGQSRSPDFTAGLLLNCTLYPFIGILFWLVGRRLIGKAAIIFAIVAMINPWQIQLLTEAVAETTFLFFIFITFCFIFKRSNWCYVFASLTTMVRYEGAALIFAAFVMDMLYLEGRKAKFRAFGFSALASLPLMGWMGWTFLNWDSSGPTHYLKIFSSDYKAQFGDSISNRVGVGKNIKLLWHVTFAPLFMPPPKAGAEFAEFIMGFSKFIASIAFIFGSIYSLFKKQWQILSLMLFLVPYFIIHAMYPYPIPRFHSTVAPIVLLIVCYGLKSFWDILNKDSRLPKTVVGILQVCVFFICVTWVTPLFRYLSQIAAISKDSVTVPYVAVAAVLVIVIAGIFVCRHKKMLSKAALLAFAVLIIVSNQFMLARVVGNGEYNIEFKYLLDWYLDNAEEGEKMVLTVPVILQIMAPEHKDSFVHTKDIDAENPNEFVQRCYEQGISYVAWDSRMGLTPKDHYYGYWKMKNIAPLGRAADNGPYKFVTQIRANQRRYINIFRLRELKRSLVPDKK